MGLHNDSQVTFARRPKRDTRPRPGGHSERTHAAVSLNARSHSQSSGERGESRYLAGLLRVSTRLTTSPRASFRWLHIRFLFHRSPSVHAARCRTAQSATSPYILCAELSRKFRALEKSEGMSSDSSGFGNHLCLLYRVSAFSISDHSRRPCSPNEKC